MFEAGKRKIVGGLIGFFSFFGFAMMLYLMSWFSLEFDAMLQMMPFVMQTLWTAACILAAAFGLNIFEWFAKAKMNGKNGGNENEQVSKVP